MKEINEAAMSYTVTPSFSMFNQNGLLKPYGYQAMANAVADEHLLHIHCAMSDLSKYDMSWVLLSSAFEIINPVESIATFRATTWASEQKGFTFRRDFQFTDEQGKPIFNAATYSALFEMKERRILLPSQLPIEIPEQSGQLALEAVHHMRNRADMKTYDRRRIYPSCLDKLGHTNNERYGEFMYDALSEQEIADFRKLRRFEIFYIEELRLGESFELRRGEDNDGNIIIDGIADGAKRASFCCRIGYGE